MGRWCLGICCFSFDKDRVDSSGGGLTRHVLDVPVTYTWT